MVNIEGQMVLAKQTGVGRKWNCLQQCPSKYTLKCLVKTVPSLLSIENTMKLSPMIVQALFNSHNPLLQLPHLTEVQLKYFETKKVCKEFFVFFSLLLTHRSFFSVQFDLFNNFSRWMNKNVVCCYVVWQMNSILISWMFFRSILM